MRVFALYLRGLTKLIFSLSAAVLILCCFCGVYNYSGVHITNETGATDYKWEPGQLKAIMTEGFAWFHMDGFGFNNADEDVLQGYGNLNILLMGSSHMEAVSIGDSENTGYLLNVMLPDMTVYNIGISGHTIIHCVNNMNDAARQYNPSDYVILETSDICPDEDEMLRVINNNHARIPSYDSGLLYVLQKRVPAVKTLYKSILDWRDCSAVDSGKSASEEHDASESFSVSDSYRDTLSGFLHIASSAVSETGAKLIIFYHQTSEIDGNGRMINTTAPEALELFRSVCEEQGIIFVDMAEPFRKLYEEEHILAHGFINSGIGVGHLNRHGHRVIAETLSELIKSDMEGKNNVSQ